MHDQDGWEPRIAVDEGGARPLYLRISDALRRDVRRGRLRPGQRLPGSRTLADDLGVHRNTVLAALDELSAQGWIVRVPARGTFIASDLPPATPGRAGAATSSHALTPGFDLPRDSAVRGLWQTLADRGVTSLMPELGARPHISLTVFDELYPPDVHEALQNFAAEVAPIPLQFSAVGIFPTAEGVVFLAPVVTQRLLDVHADFHARMAALGRQSLPYYRPGNWVPHCTVAMNLPPEQIPTTVAICKAAPVFHAFSLVGLDLIEFRPVKTIYEFPLVG